MSLRACLYTALLGVSACSFALAGEDSEKKPIDVYGLDRFGINEFTYPPADTVPLPSPIDSLLTRMIGPSEQMTADDLARMAVLERKKAEAEEKSRSDAAKVLADIDKAINEMRVVPAARLEKDGVTYETVIVAKIRKHDYLAAIRYARDFLETESTADDKAHIWHNMAYCWYEFLKPVQNSTLRWECLKRAIDAQGHALDFKRKYLASKHQEVEEQYATWEMECAMLLSIFGNDDAARKMYKRAQDDYDKCLKDKQIASPPKK